MTKLKAKVVFGHISLSAFRCGGKIAVVIYPSNFSELKEAVEMLNTYNEPYRIIANGTNILINDKGIDGVIICTKNLCGIDTQDGLLYVNSGESMPKLCVLAKQSGLSGIEGLCSVPGTIGGGVIMNCSAFGRQLADVTEYVDMLIDGKLERVQACDMGFGYRKSNAKSLGIVVGVGIKLVQSDKYSVARAMQEYKLARQKSQPCGISLGSTFKKVGDISAGYYIEKVGLKGKQIGGAIISQKHANFIINTGNAKAADFVALSNLARQEVDKSFGIGLQYEVEFM